MYVDCGTLFTGDDVIADARVVVEDGRVQAVGTQESIPEEGERVDHSGEVVCPGFVDAHCHLIGARSMDPMTWATEGDALGAARATADLRDLLAAGFTAVRDVGSRTGLGLRDAVADGEIPGPRVFTSGKSISQTGGHGDLHALPYDWVRDDPSIATLADGPAECRKAARKRIREGADLLKIMTTGGVLSERDSPAHPQFTDAEVRAIVEEAHRVEIPVASHAQGAGGVKRALENGVDTIEHGFHLDEACLDLFLERGATFVPTLAIMHRIVAAGDEHGVPDHGLRKSRRAREAHYESTRRAYEAGVPIAAGTDFIGPELVPHGENALEMELLVEEVGMSPREAIEAGTRVAARTLPVEDVGTVQAGNRADLGALAGDPRDDIGHVRDVVATYVGGERSLARA
jgi:imidazolonepropionase-like amidohydrolase